MTTPPCPTCGQDRPTTDAYLGAPLAPTAGDWQPDMTKLRDLMLDDPRYGGANFLSNDDAQLVAEGLVEELRRQMAEWSFKHEKYATLSPEQEEARGREDPADG